MIVCTKGSPTLSKCLDSLENQKYKNYEVIVVSFKKSVGNLVSNYKNSKFILSEKANLSAQRNIGIENSAGEIIAFIDDDAIADVKWLFELERCYKKNIVCVGGRLEPEFVNDVPDQLKKLPDDIFRGIVGLTFVDYENTKTLTEPQIWGCNMSFSKKVFEKIDKFDENLGRGLRNVVSEDDIDIQERILESKMKIVYNPKALVRHIINREKLSATYFIRRSFWQGYSEIVRYSKHKNFQMLTNKKNTPLIASIVRKKMNELLFEMIGEPNLKYNIDTARKLGRLVTYLSMLEN